MARPDSPDSAVRPEPTEPTELSVQPAPSAPIVAELGRPETPDETAARKAENSRRHRENQTTRNLVLSLIASLALVLFIVLVVVRPTPAPAPPVDWAAVAADAQGSAPGPLAVPKLPVGWTSNNATVSPAADGTSVWHIGFLTPKHQYIALEQGLGQSAQWIGGLIGSTKPSGTVTLDRHEWTIYNRRTENPTGNYAYALTATVGGSEFVLHGTADDEEFGALVTALTASMPIPVD
jgi:hypothetical protein